LTDVLRVLHAQAKDSALNEIDVVAVRSQISSVVLMEVLDHTAFGTLERPIAPLPVALTILDLPALRMVTDLVGRSSCKSQKQAALYSFIGFRQIHHATVSGLLRSWDQGGNGQAYAQARQHAPYER
jgi:hypothetical protein